jgi:hypothetical protein
MRPRPVYDQLPTDDGGYQPYKAAGKLKGKKALITGGDSYALQALDYFVYLT